MHFFKLLPAYIRAHMPYFIMGSMITAVFSAMTFLYRLPADGIFYAVILCLCIAVLCIIPSFRRFVHLHKRLSEITGLHTIEAPMLPKVRKIPEKDYDLLCRKLIHQLETLESEQAAEREDMIDYYTLWMHQIKTPIFAMQLLLSDNASSVMK